MFDHLFVNCLYCCILCGSNAHREENCRNSIYCSHCNARHPPAACPLRCNPPGSVSLSRGVLNRQGSRTSLDVQASGPGRPAPPQDPISPYQHSIYPPPGHNHCPPGDQGQVICSTASATYGGIVRQGDHMRDKSARTAGAPGGQPPPGSSMMETMRLLSGPPPPYQNSNGTLGGQMIMAAWGHRHHHPWRFWTATTNRQTSTSQWTKSDNKLDCGC